MQTNNHDGSPHTSARNFWNEKYSSRQQLWSGKVNSTFAQLIETLPAGRSLDIGCGEGADVLWLAQHGWDAVGLEISRVAVERATAQAKRLGIAEKASFFEQDLELWNPSLEDKYDLVTASFFQSPASLERTNILLKAIQQVASGGHIFLLSHAAPPSWDPNHGPAQLIKPEDELSALRLESDEWKVLRAECVEREVSAPDGNPGTMTDTVVFAQRR